jgi:methyl-accepting chemotaxis protein
MKGLLRPDSWVRGIKAKNLCGRVRAHWSGKKWGGVLQEISDEIGELNERTGEEFLSIGSKLQSFYRDAKEISGISTVVTDLMSGDRITTAIGGLRGILSRMEHLEGESKRRTRVLEEVNQILDGAGGSLAGFRTLVRTLHMFCTATRVESAHIDNADLGFDTLSDDIRKLAGEIEAKSAAIMGQLEKLSLLLRKNLLKVVELETRQHGRTRAILDQTESGLAALVEKHKQTVVVTKNISTHYEQLSKIIGEIVTSLQFQDITRQQMEHVAEALGQLIAADPASPRLAHADFAAAAEVCALQALQLRHAGGDLVKAVQDIIDFLREAARKVSGITADTVAVTGGAETAGNSFLNSLEEQLSTITSAFQEYAETDSQLSGTMNSIAAAVSDMSVSVSDIEKIGRTLRLISLNALIKAAHIGEEGAPLGILADSIHNLSLDTAHHTKTISDLFGSITGSAQRLCSADTGENESSEPGVEQMAAEIGGMMEALRQVNDDISSRLSVLDRSSEELLHSIETTTAEIDIHKKVEEITDKIAEQLDMLRDDLREAAPAGVRFENGSRAQDLLKSIESSYTMQSERRLHQLASETASAAGADLPVPDAESKEPDGNEGTEGDDLGDNVELF